MLNLLTIAIVLATFNEQLVEQLLGRWESPTVNKLLVYVVMLLGIAEGFAFGLNGIAMSGLQGINAPAWVGNLATGVLIGSGSRLIHSLMGKAEPK